jgi:hypothetical protein
MQHKQHLPSIYEHLVEWDGKSDLVLPVTGISDMVPGGEDGVLSSHVAPVPEREEAEIVYKVSNALSEVVYGLPEHRSEYLRALYAVLVPIPLIQYSKSLSQEIVRRNLKREILREIAISLIIDSCDLEPLKFGILVFGLSAHCDDVSLLTPLAKYEELTLFVIDALERVSEKPLPALLSIAQDLTGWGKVRMVEHLSRIYSTQPLVQQWLLNEGWRTNGLDEYVALTCAVHGRLVQALSESGDGYVTHNACSILIPLLEKTGAMKDIGHWSEGVRAVQLTLERIESEPIQIYYVYFLARLALWVDAGAAVCLPRHRTAFDKNRNKRWLMREKQGWTESVRAAISGRCMRTLKSSDSISACVSAFNSDVFLDRWYAWEVSFLVGVDLWEAALERLRKCPLDAVVLRQVLDTDDESKLGVVFDVVLQPLLAMPCGDTSDECLEQILVRMRSSGCRREELIDLGFNSKSRRNRSLAAVLKQPAD